MPIKALRLHAEHNAAARHFRLRMRSVNDRRGAPRSAVRGDACADCGPCRTEGTPVGRAWAAAVTDAAAKAPASGAGNRQRQREKRSACVERIGKYE